MLVFQCVDSVDSLILHHFKCKLLLFTVPAVSKKNLPNFFLQPKNSTLASHWESTHILRAGKFLCKLIFTGISMVYLLFDDAYLRCVFASAAIKAIFNTCSSLQMKNFKLLGSNLYRTSRTINGWNQRIHRSGKGKSSSKPSFSVSMLIFRGVRFFPNSPQKKTTDWH